MRRIGSKLIDRVPLAIWRAVAPRRSIGFYYHLVSDESRPHVRHYRYKSNTQFAADVETATASLGTISHEEIEDSIRKGRTSRSNRALFTFDDGFVECLTNAAVILERYSAPAVFFITADFVANRVAGEELLVGLCIDRVVTTAEPGRLDQAARIIASKQATEMSSPTLGARRRQRARVPELDSATAEHAARREEIVQWLLGLRDHGYSLVAEMAAALEVDPAEYLRTRQPYLDENGIQELARRGFTIGAHGCSHRRLQTLDEAERRREIVRSCEIVRELTGRQRVPFAFPYGGLGLDRTELLRIQRENEVVGTYYDTGGIGITAEGIVMRLWCDMPWTDGGGLIQNLQGAWWRGLRSGVR